MAFEERYYQEELDYVRQLGKLLAKDKPYLARFLAEKEGDPDVERLLEAFAFLSGGCGKNWKMSFRSLRTASSACCGPTICARSRP